VTISFDAMGIRQQQLARIPGRSDVKTAFLSARRNELGAEQLTVQIILRDRERRVTSAIDAIRRPVPKPTQGEGIQCPAATAGSYGGIAEPHAVQYSLQDAERQQLAP
jgi:hypothetical protein